MSAEIDDIHINFEEDGVLVVKELDKRVLTRGAWTTVMFKYQEWDKKNNNYGTIKFSIRRYQKRDGEYKQKSKFNISSEDQAKQVIEILQTWLQEKPEASDE